MYKKGLLLFFTLLLSYFTFAQNEANNWYFGNHAGVTFNSGAPVALTDNAFITREGCATISNSMGDLLFYTDGSNAYNSLHNVMQNGDGLLGDPSSTQSAIIVPKPNDPTIYYLFTVAKTAQSNGLRYSIVDMSLDGGLGGITSTKNVYLRYPMSEKINAVLHENGQDIWVLAHGFNNNEFYAYLITASGLNTVPVTSAVGVTVDSGIINTIGVLKASPNGNKLAMCVRNLKTQVFDFNTNTGVVSNPIDLYSGFASYATEFSPSGNLLYVSHVNNRIGLWQYDLRATDIASSAQLITQIPSNNPDAVLIGQLQIGPDSKIYVSVFNSEYLSVIEEPENLGTACNFILEAVYLEGRTCEIGLPAFIQSYFYVGFEFENVCLGETTTFTADFPDTYDSILWDFGDGNTSTLENPTHIYATEGDFNATLTVTANSETSTDTKVVTIYEQPTATQPQDILECDTNNDGFYEFDLTLQDIDILNGQSASTFEILYYASLTDYTSETPITNPTTYTNTTAYISQNIIASIRNRNNADCEAMTDFNIQVFDVPMPSLAVPPIEDCDNSSFGTDTDGMIYFDLTENETTILNTQSATDFTVNYFTDVGLTTQITTPNNYQNTNATETIYVQVVNNNNTNCVAETSFTIEVFEKPTVTPIVSLRQCDDDLDGYSAFNLNEATDEITANATNEIVTFYESQLDAENENIPIPNPTAYINENVSTDSVWARVENSNGCFRTAQINLVVSTTQIPLTFTRDFYECDDAIDGNSTNGISTFNFSNVTTEIEALFPVGQQLVITYYRNLADALAENNAITDITNYRNIGYPNTQNIYIRVDSLLDNDCLGLGEHITLHVETVPVANTIVIPEQCDDDGDSMYAFDTSTIQTDIIGSQTNVTVTYTDENGMALPSPLPNPFNTATQTVTVRVTNVTSQDPDGACYDENTIAFVVDAAAVANPIADIMECDDDNDGQFAFDTSTFEATILNGQTGMQVTYTDEDGNALSSPLPNPFVSETQTITVRVENTLSATCYDETTINLIVNEQPIANTIQDDIVCDDASNDGEHGYTLTDYNTQILDTQSSTIFEVIYFDDLTNAENNVSPLPYTYLSTATSETIYARIHNRNNTDCYAITTFQIGVSYLPIAHQPDNFIVCDDASNDGEAEFNLSNQNIDILNGQSETENIITFHLSQEDADDNTDDIAPLFTNTEANQTIYVRVENINNTNCYATTSFNVVVVEQPVITMEDNWPICEGDTVEIFADEGFDEYLWSTGETTSSIIVDQTGNYDLTVTNIYGDVRCEDSQTVTVVQSDIAIITNIETIDWSQTNNEILITVSGNGDYEYSIDGFNYQDSNQFTNLEAGEFLVYVRDKNGCGVITEEVYLMYYPNFFTPNNDSYNDYWQLHGSKNEPANKIYIYDRYGKLLKQLSPKDIGWDGTFNGNPLPTSDYWFLLERQNGKQYQGHFTLKR